jgi:class 3 adenylate cyclase
MDGRRQPHARDLVFTEIVDSTRVATALGDRRWRQLLDDHDSTLRRLLGAVALKGLDGEWDLYRVAAASAP